MQTKTIKKVTTAKLEEWLGTITDEELRKKVKDNIIVSGGSIASMFLKESVNDYDIYIKSIHVLEQLVKYYTSEFKDTYGITILKGTDKELYMSKRGYNSKESNPYQLAVNNLKPNQIKLFFDDESKGGIRVNEGEEDLFYEPEFFSPNAISLSNDIQIVTRFSGTVEEVHKTFDFIHATNYFTFEEGLVTNIRAMESLMTKQLFYQGSLYPVTSMIRIKKFLSRGYKISAGEMLKIMFQISELNLSDPDVLEDQLIGVDVAYFETLISVLRGSNEKVSSDYLNKMIDKIFN
jgi:hypothetical protein